MTIPIFIGIAAVIFIVGVLFVVKGVSSEEQEAVPISNPEEIQKLKSAFVPPKSPDVQAPVEVQSPADPKEPSPQMIEENHQLRKDLNDQKARFEELEKDMEVLKKDYLRMQDHKLKEFEALEKEKAQFDGERQMLSSKGDLLSELKVKTEMLERQYDEVQKQRTEMNMVISQLKAEKDALTMQTKLREEQVAGEIKAQRAEASRVEFASLSSKLIESIATIADLKRENKDLQKANQELADAFKETEELNAHLSQKEKMIQYELTKNRAQALGLEKICEDFRTQIEIMSEAASR